MEKRLNKLRDKDNNDMDLAEMLLRDEDDPLAKQYTQSSFDPTRSQPGFNTQDEAERIL